MENTKVAEKVFEGTVEDLITLLDRISWVTKVERLEKGVKETLLNNQTYKLTTNGYK